LEDYKKPLEDYKKPLNDYKKPSEGSVQETVSDKFIEMGRRKE
jgi:hypothetical protein